MQSPSTTQADPSGVRTPGQVFASAAAEAGTSARVEFPITITEQFPGFARRPRIAMRSLFKVVKTEAAAAQFWFESRPSDDKRAAGEEIGSGTGSAGGARDK